MKKAYKAYLTSVVAEDTRISYHGIQAIRNFTVTNSH